MLYSRPDLLHRILDVNARAVTAYLNAQIAAGAQAVQIFDTWGGTLSRRARSASSRSRIRRQVLAGITRTHEERIVPRILFTKGGGQWLEAMAQSRRRRARHRLADTDSATRAAASAPAWRCRATSIPWPSSHRRRRSSAEARARPATPTARVRGTSSTSATASRSTRRRSTSHALVEAVHARSVGAHAR